MDTSSVSRHSETSVTSRSAAAANIDRLVRWADDFPTAGVRFADLTPVLADADGLASIVDEMAAAGQGADLVAGIDARGFLLGAGIALALGSGVLAMRKAGKLPPPVVSQRYELEYGTAELEIPEAIDVSGRRILVVDDVLATGGTIAAAAELLRKRGAEVVGAAVVLEISALGGRARCDGYPLTCLRRV
ncbi:adenine phosphoribosyltransferase [Rhodococcoides kyotonense]|uniref:Adenine phosphoribosyltransferase n=1 Tax=Rhodococcoides kyotonense TaxID=398843 RepID=A0A239CV66_9NOCA|nr:adenine phosphoribosyltransferase [Rhodococcus kyotonensis]SNS23688.1 adenine phosphoribosyltransferase [Rhodococcus kyotonensis]